MKRILFLVLLFVCGIASAQHYREPWVSKAKSTSGGTHDSIFVSSNYQAFHLEIHHDGGTSTDTLWCARNLDTARANRHAILKGETFAPVGYVRANSIRLWSSSGNAIPYRFLAY